MTRCSCSNVYIQHLLQSPYSDIYLLDQGGLPTLCSYSEVEGYDLQFLSDLIGGSQGAPHSGMIICVYVIYIYIYMYIADFILHTINDKVGQINAEMYVYM